MVAHRGQFDHSETDWGILDPGDAGAINPTMSGVCNLVTATAETRTLARPAYSGQWMMLMFDTDGGDCVITCATLFNQDGNNTLTFAEAGESIMLFAGTLAGALVWRTYAMLPILDSGTLSTA